MVHGVKNPHAVTTSRTMVNLMNIPYFMFYLNFHKARATCPGIIDSILVEIQT